MKVRFDVEKKDNQSLFSEDELIKKIDKSLEQAESGKTKPLTKTQQKELLGL